MNMLANEWRLCSWSAVWAEELAGDAEEFLHQDPADPNLAASESGEVRGVTLTIQPSGEFTQAGQANAAVLTYDEQGVQVAGVALFSGTVRQEGDRWLLLCPELPRWATPKDPLAAQRLRWDDGDTKVCDSLQLVGEQLIRSLCVVTD